MQTGQILRLFFSPVFGAVLKTRLEGLVICGAAALQLGLVWAHLPGWPCPFKAAFGIPCPGCGLTTACTHLLSGDWKGALTTHAFAPLAVLALATILVVSILPETSRRAVVQKIGAFESHTGFSAWMLAGLFLYWGLRLLHIV
jgi:hypothetical protein